MHSTRFRSTFLIFFKFPQIKEGGHNFLGGTNSAERLNYLVPLLYFNFKNLRDPNSSSSSRFQCILHDSEVLFSFFSNFLKLKRGDQFSWGEPILQNSLIIWSPLLYFNFKNLMDPNSSWLGRFQYILHDSAVLFSVFSNFLKLKRADLISWWEPILQNGWIIWSPLLYFNFKNLRDPNSSSSGRFQCALHDAAVHFSVFSNFLKLKMGELISWGEPILENGWIIWSPFLISILKIWGIQILRHSVDFNAFYTIQKCFSNFFQISSN